MSFDGEIGPPVSSLEPPPEAASQRPTLVERVMALLEVVICSDYPTQLALSTTVAALGFGPYDAHGELSLAYVVVLSLADTALLLALIAMFLSIHGEGARDLFLGTRSISAEARLGLPLALAALLWSPIAWLLYDGLGVPILAVSAALFAMVLGTAAPVWIEASVWCRRAAAIAASAVVVVGFVGAVFVPRFSTDHPRKLNLWYRLDASSGPWWLASANAGDLPPSLRAK